MESGRLWDVSEIPKDIRHLFEEVEVECGTPYEHRMEKTDEPDLSAKGSRFDIGKTGSRDGGDRTQKGERTTTRDLGYHPACVCGADVPSIPGLVLDPFSGSGTVCQVSQRHGRRSLGIDLADQTEVMRVRWGKPKDDPAAQNTLDMDVEVVVPGVAITHHTDNVAKE